MCTSKQEIDPPLWTCSFQATNNLYKVSSYRNLLQRTKTKYSKDNWMLNHKNCNSDIHLEKAWSWWSLSDYCSENIRSILNSRQGERTDSIGTSLGWLWWIYGEILHDFPQVLSENTEGQKCRVFDQKRNYEMFSIHDRLNWRLKCESLQRCYRTHAQYFWWMCNQKWLRCWGNHYSVPSDLLKSCD